MSYVTSRTFPSQTYNMPQRTATALTKFLKQSLVRRLTRRGNPTKPPARLIDLPSGVLMRVVGYLSPKSAAAIVLTCKTFYIQLRHEHMLARLPLNREIAREQRQKSIAQLPLAVRRRRLSDLLFHIPPELLLCILDHLPRESAMALSFTCKALHTRFPQRYTIDRKSPAVEQHKLLSLLVRDIPDYVACPSCTRFHHNRNLHHYSGAVATRNKHGQLPACVVDDENRNMAYLAPVLLGSTVCRMVMEKHKRKPRSTSLLTQLYDKKVITSTSTNYLKKEKIEIRIINGKLMIHEATMLTPKWACNPFEKDIEVFRADHHEGHELASYLICSHIRLMNVCWSHRAVEIQTCEECHTEYRADIWTCKTGNARLTFERWMDLGLGPDDPKWDEHFPSHVDDWFIANAPVPDNPVKATTIASLFSKGSREPLYNLNSCFPIRQWMDLVAAKSPHRKPRCARFTDNGQTKYVKSFESTRQPAINT